MQVPMTVATLPESPLAIFAISVCHNPWALFLTRRDHHVMGSRGFCQPIMGSTPLRTYATYQRSQRAACLLRNDRERVTAFSLRNYLAMGMGTSCSDTYISRRLVMQAACHFTPSSTQNTRTYKPVTTIVGLSQDIIPAHYSRYISQLHNG